MDIDESWTTHWSPCGQNANCESTTERGTTIPQYDEEDTKTFEGHNANTYPGRSVGFDCGQWLTDSKMETHSSTWCQNNLPLSVSFPHLDQKEWESWDAVPPLKQKQHYKKKWAVLRGNRQLSFPLEFRHIPWPIFRAGEGNLEINTPSVENFLFGETRGNTSTSESRKIAKDNLRLFHSDKFASTLDTVVPQDKESARESAENVCRVLTRYLYYT
ncbi:hypothetical protein B0H14DRAFT_2542608 [Mycena olivaceomarginata]|nr:hypothetical protein B0H14DRAFT_2542608 [Mycena olivaceomarginata]